MIPVERQRPADHRSPSWSKIRWATSSTFKAAVSRQAVRDGVMPRGTPIWQRGYYETIIRDAASHDRIAQYIADNPANWKGDRFNR